MGHRVSLSQPAWVGPLLSPSALLRRLPAYSASSFWKQGDPAWHHAPCPKHPPLQFLQAEGKAGS